MGMAVIITFIVAFVVGVSSMPKPSSVSDLAKLEAENARLEDRNLQLGALKLIDDGALESCSDALLVSQKAVMAAFTRDTVALDDSTDKLTKISERVKIQLEDRQEVLTKLGY